MTMHVDATLRAINTGASVVIMGVLAWVALTTVDTHAKIVGLTEQIAAFKAEQRHIERRIDQHDGRFENYSSRIRALEHRTARRQK